jgi:hypothetical protein
MSDLPTIVYRSPGPLAGPHGSWDSLGVETQEALDAALASGWHPTLPAAYAALHAPAPAPKPVAAPEPDDNAPPTRAEMEEKAAELGIEVDGRWSDKTLLAKITAALEAG